MAWKLKICWSRGSEKYDSTTRLSLRKPPVRTRRTMGPRGQARSRGESKLRSMKLGSSSRYRPVSQSQKRPKASASAGPARSPISACMRWRSCHTRSSLPSAKQARYMGSTGTRVRWAAMSSPAAANTSARMPVMVRTLGPVSNR